MRRFRAQELTVAEALADLGLGRTRFDELFASYLAACAKRHAASWSPAASGGNHRAPLPASVAATLRKLLPAAPPCSYSLAAPEALRRHDFAIDRATVRRWALREGLAPLGPRKKAPRPVRRWQVQEIGQLWQYDASPHRWFHGQDRQPSLLEIIDDHSRVIPGARLYERENLPAHLDFLPLAFRSDADKHRFAILPKRWIVERTFGWLSKFRRLAKDYEFRTENSETMIHFARSNAPQGAKLTDRVMVIKTNIAAQNGARLLSESSNSLSKSLARLSSGSKLVSPEDDAAGLAASMRFDAQISRTAAASSNLGNAISFSQTQDGFIKKVAKVSSPAPLRAAIARLPLPFSKVSYRKRHLVENFLERIKNFRRVATRYDKLAETFFGFACLASTLVSLLW